MPHVFDIEELKKMDFAEISRAVDIAIDCMVYPNRLRNWKTGDSIIEIRRWVARKDVPDYYPEHKTQVENKENLHICEAANSLALRYIFFLFKKRVAEKTGIPATSNNDIPFEHLNSI